MPGIDLDRTVSAQMEAFAGAESPREASTPQRRAAGGAREDMQTRDMGMSGDAPCVVSREDGAMGDGAELGEECEACSRFDPPTQHPHDAERSVWPTCLKGIVQLVGRRR